MACGSVWRRCRPWSGASILRDDVAARPLFVPFVGVEQHGISRRNFFSIGGATALVWRRAPPRSAACSDSPDQREKVRPALAGRQPRHRTHDLAPGVRPQRDARRSPDDLHANAVLVLGHEPERLIEAAELAADEGLAVWIEARRFDADPDETLTFLEGVARAPSGSAATAPRSACPWASSSRSSWPAWCRATTGWSAARRSARPTPPATTAGSTGSWPMRSPSSGRSSAAS